MALSFAIVGIFIVAAGWWASGQREATLRAHVEMQKTDVLFRSLYIEQLESLLRYRSIDVDVDRLKRVHAEAKSAAMSKSDEAQSQSAYREYFDAHWNGG